MKNLSELLKYGLYLDTETAGIDPVKNGLVSIGLVTASGEEMYRECRLYNDQVAEPEALVINGYTEEQVRDPLKPLPHQIVQEVVDFAKKRNTMFLIGKNPEFDWKMLEYPYVSRLQDTEYNGKKFPFSYRMLDVGGFGLMLWLALDMVVPPYGISSADLQKILKLDPEPKPHNALTGARYNKALLEAIVEAFL